MKKPLLLLLLSIILLPTKGMSQLTCGDLFTDNGGSAANYLPNSTTVQTICSTVPGEQVIVSFSTFDVEYSYDGLYVYDGNSVTAPQLASANGAGSGSATLVPGAYWGITAPQPFISTNNEGCLTFKFVSDSSINKMGWVAQVECITTVNCLFPTDVTVTAVDYDSAMISWTENNNATNWEIIVLPAAANAPTFISTGTPITANPAYAATGLTYDVLYKAYIRSVCSTTEKSLWKQSALFQTLACIVPTTLSVDNITATDATLSWSNSNTTPAQWQVLVLPATAAAPTATDAGIVSFTNSYVAENLITNTAYRFYVRLQCAANDYTAWSNGYNFTPYVSLPPMTTNTTQYTAEQLVTDVLINNPCVQVSNVTSSTGTNFGTAFNGIGYFINNNPTFSLTSGIVLSTGNAANVPGPNTSTLNEGTNSWTGDGQLETIISTATGAPMASFNATKLEFDFTSLNEFMSFNFLFASEEYGTFQCEYADAFAFLLTDMTTGITTNIAVLPGTTIPISVVTIRDYANNNSCGSANQNFFDQYFEGNYNYTAATNFNGQTHVMTAASPIIAGNPYHVKLVIADRGDSLYDSAVFIQEGSFTTGPPECVDKIRLVSFIDENNNGVKDTDENEFTFGNFTVDTNNSGTPNDIISPIGSYTIYYTNPTDVYDFSYSINAEYAPYYTAATTAFDNISIVAGSGTTIYYFPVTLTQTYNDVTVSLSPSIPPRPGMSYSNKVVYTNLGVASTSGTITFTTDAQATITSISQANTVLTASGFTYNFTNLAPYESRTFTVVMTAANAPAVNIDDLLTSSVSIASTTGTDGPSDINLANNSYTNHEVVVASYDPNDKMEAHGPAIQHDLFTTNDYLYYTIRFQNNGTANAINVRIEDVLDPRMDEHSIRMVSASHNYLLERMGNQLTWHFDYIQLAPFTLYNEEASKGYVTFKIKLKPGFAIGDIIPNTGSIYFDNNPAIVTNTFNTEFVQTLGTSTFVDSNVVVYPNPATSYVQIALTNSAEQISAVQLFDLLGKKIMEQNNIVGNQTMLNTASLSKGMYLIEIKSNTNLKLVKKLVIK